MSVCREYRLTGAPDVNHVLAWGSSHAQTGEVAVVYVEHRDPEGGLGLIRLSGEDPAVGSTPHRQVAEGAGAVRPGRRS